LLRVPGAAAGTVTALVAAQGTAAHDGATVALILAAVFLGLWLRPLGYAWWALFVTLALALLQGFDGAAVCDVLSPRLAAIAISAVLGVGAAWRALRVLTRRTRGVQPGDWIDELAACCAPAIAAP
jgi:uncharacterized membrane protein YccC